MFGILLMLRILERFFYLLFFCTFSERADLITDLDVITLAVRRSQIGPSLTSKASLCPSRPSRVRFLYQNSYCNQIHRLVLSPRLCK
jgi:hypothetical protein